MMTTTTTATATATATTTVTTTLCSERKHLLTFSAISPWIGFMQNFQGNV